MRAYLYVLKAAQSLHSRIILHGLANHPAERVQVVLKDVANGALFGAHQLWQLTQLGQALVADLLDLAERSAEVLVAQTVERHVADHILPSFPGFFGQAADGHHVVHHCNTRLVHRLAHGLQVWVCVVLGHKLVDLGVFEVNQEARAVFSVGPTHLIQAHTFEHTAGDLGSTFTVVPVLLTPCVDQGIHLGRGAHTVDALHNPQTCCWVFDQPAHLEVFQQGLGVVLCLTVQTHRVELAQTVTHGTVKLLAQAMLDCGCGIRNLRTELDAVARLGRRHARFERRDQCLEASLLVGVQRTHAVDQGLGAVRDGEQPLGFAGSADASLGLFNYGCKGDVRDLLRGQVFDAKRGA